MIESFNDIPKDGTTTRSKERRNQLYNKLGFKYFENEDLDTNKAYVLLDSNSTGWMRFINITNSNRNNNKIASFGGYLSHSCALLPFDKLVGTEVILKSPDGTFKGKISYPCLTDKDNNMFCRVYWLHGQKNTPHGWVNINSLNF